MTSWQELFNAIQDQNPVSGLTHNFYKYPARFAPSFARQAILSFTEPGDLVYDPFMGGGTSLVEARSLGRRAAGTDISSLAVFLSQSKTLRLTDGQLQRVARWGARLIPRLNVQGRSERPDEWIASGYQRNISDNLTWRIRKLLEIALNDLNSLSAEAEKRFARCVLLRAGQWAFDCREDVPPVQEFRQRLTMFLEEMIAGARQFAAEVKRAGNAPEPVCLHRSATGVEEDGRLRALGIPALVLTSPPYPGVHVLYHRWQILGRRETPAPFWIAGTLDGAGASF